MSLLQLVKAIPNYLASSASDVLNSTRLPGDIVDRWRCYADGSNAMAGPVETVTGLTFSGTTVTVTVAAGTSLAPTDKFTLTGVVGVTNVNGTNLTVATRPTTTTFTFTAGTTPTGAWTSGGSIQRVWGGNGISQEGLLNLILQDATRVVTAIRGRVGTTQNLSVWYDYLLAPIAAVAQAGGFSVFGDNLRVFGTGSVFDPEIKLRLDGTVQARKGDAAGGAGVLALGDASTWPSAQPDGTHTLDGSNTVGGVVLYSKNGRPYIVDRGGIHREIGSEAMRRVMAVQKDVGLATVTAIGVPAPTFSGVGTGNTQASADNIFVAPLVQITAAATASNANGLTPSTYTQVQPSFTPMMWSRIYTDTAAVTTVRYWVGLFSASPAAVASPTAIHCAAFRYDTSVDGTAFWRCVTSAASATPTVTTTTVAVATSTMYDLRIEFNNNNNSVRFLINDILVATHTTTLPTAALAPDVRVTTLAAAARSINFARYIVDQVG